MEKVELSGSVRESDEDIFKISMSYDIIWYYGIWNCCQSLIHHCLYSQMGAGKSIVRKGNEDDI